MRAFQRCSFGTAFTCHSEPVLDRQHIDDSIRIKMFQHSTKVVYRLFPQEAFVKLLNLVISLRIAKKLGAAGAVIDAPTRDLRIIRGVSSHYSAVECNP